MSKEETKEKEKKNCKLLCAIRQRDKVVCFHKKCIVHRVQLEIKKKIIRNKQTGT